MPFNPFGAKTYTLASAISSTATSITLSSFKEPVTDTPYTMALLNTSIVYGTIAPKTSSSEFISFTGITQNANGSATLTGVTRGLAKKSPFTETTAYKLPHSGQSQFIISDAPQLFKKYGALENNEVLTGFWEAGDPLTAQGLVTRDYMLALINGGTISTNALKETGTAGETLVAGNLVYLKSSDGRWWKTDADLVATIENVQLGIAQGAGTAGNAIAGGVLRRGLDTNQSGGSIGLAYASNTAGGISTTPGTVERVVGVFLSATNVVFDPFFYYTLTAAQKAALAGSQGVPSSTNKYITQDNVYTDITDQTQTTQNASVETGEANATTRKNKVAQSFTPIKTKMRGVSLYKLADLGTFTGTVTISLQTDSSGSPSGSDLASITISNANWLALPVGEFNAIFSTEYGSLVAGSLYWIVISTSTSDNSNHPNIGTNSSGGYANGSVKYNNTTDGWVAISTIDLYFKTLQGVNNQVGVTPIVQTFLNNATWIKPTSTLPFKVFVQCWGGGGSGGKNAVGANGGGGGAYAEAWLDSSQVSATEVVVVGSGGAAISAANTNGNVGGNSSFGGKLTAYGGGGGGQGNTAGGGGGGTGSAGVTAGNGGSPVMNITGGFGFGPSGVNAAGGENSHGGGGGGGVAASNGSAGGFSVYGGGGGGGAQGAGGSSIYGGGGGGGFNGAAGGTSVYGGAGGAGSTGTATAGTFPSGGGGGTSAGANSGAGANGKVTVTIIF